MTTSCFLVFVRFKGKKDLKLTKIGINHWETMSENLAYFLEQNWSNTALWASSYFNCSRYSNV